MRQYHNGVWDEESVFVFGSNLAGRHGAGAAKFAVQNCGACYGYGNGHFGKSYAIPTKDQHIFTLSLFSIEQYVFFFKQYAHTKPYLTFFVTAIGTGLAGYSHEEIAPMFKDAPDNCVLPVEWKTLLDNTPVRC